ncbi:MAG: hypothetical protein ATN33_02390 [Epulopiscium sp. Nele67-Bin001]|nr:MAG: hypothetical protein BEN18_01040 [Epulopiscium sp. Nuni2H_MBin001]OON90685.1 MAG: hypothetical protein ATN33_02390 [Epulopiscium sp. Nele67-Bin001]
MKVKKFLTVLLATAVSVIPISHISATTTYDEEPVIFVNYEDYVDNDVNNDEDVFVNYEAYAIDENYALNSIYSTELSYEDYGTYEVNSKLNDFIDVPTTAWYYSDVMNIYIQGVMSGMSVNEFKPMEYTTKAMFVSILHRISGWQELETSHDYKDIIPGAWYEAPAQWAIATQVYSGFPNTVLFAPNDNITREEIALLIYNFANYLGFDTSTLSSTSNFSDTTDISDWTRLAMQWAVGEGIITGKSQDTLDPKGTATRAEMATMVNRFLNHPQFNLAK